MKDSDLSKGRKMGLCPGQSQALFRKGSRQPNEIAKNKERERMRGQKKIRNEIEKLAQIYFPLASGLVARLQKFLFFQEKPPKDSSERDEIEKSKTSSCSSKQCFWSCGPRSFFALL